MFGSSACTIRVRRGLLIGEVMAKVLESRSDSESTEPLSSSGRGASSPSLERGRIQGRALVALLLAGLVFTAFTLWIRFEPRPQRSPSLHFEPAQADASTAPRPAAFEGTVRDAATGAPLGNALVSARYLGEGREEWERVETDEAGRFALRRDEWFRLVVAAPGYMPVELLHLQRFVTTVDLVRGVEVRGRVRMPDGRPARAGHVRVFPVVESSRSLNENCLISYRPRSSFPVPVQADGRFSTFVASDRIICTALVPGAAPTSCGPYEVTQAGCPPIDVRVERGARLEGRVVDGDANGIENVRLGFVVSSIDPETHRGYHAFACSPFRWSDSDGSFSLDGLPNTARLSAHHPGYEVERLHEVGLPSESPYEVRLNAKPITDEPTAVVESPPPLRITNELRGTVTDSSGRPIFGARVSAGPRYWWRTLEGFTDATGGFVIRDVQFDREFELSVSSRNGVVRLWLDPLMQGERREVSAELPELRRVSGAVVDELGEPIPNAAVVAIPERGRDRAVAVVVDSDGRFELQIEPGLLDLFAQAEGRARGHERLLSNASGDSLLFALPPEGVYEGLLLGEYDRPVEGGRVSVFRDELSFSATTNTQGRFRLRNLPPGRLKVNARPGWRWRRGNSRYDGWDPLEVESSEELPPVLHLTRQPVFELELATADGTPIEHPVMIRLSSEYESSGRTIRREAWRDGRAEVSTREPGWHSVFLRAPGYRPRRFEVNSVLGEPEAPVRLVLSDRVEPVAICVSDAAGKPLKGAKVGLGYSSGSAQGPRASFMRKHLGRTSEQGVLLCPYSFTDQDEVVVECLGYATRVVRWPWGAAEDSPLLVGLARESILRVEVRSPDGGNPGAGLRLNLQTFDGRMEQTHGVPPDGLVRLPGLSADRWILTVTTESWRFLAEKTVRLHPGGSHEVVVEVSN